MDSEVKPENKSNYKQMRGFAVMTKEKHLSVSSRGGKNSQKVQEEKKNKTKTDSNGSSQ